MCCGVRAAQVTTDARRGLEGEREDWLLVTGHLARTYPGTQAAPASEQVRHEDVVVDKRAQDQEHKPDDLQVAERLPADDQAVRPDCDGPHTVEHHPCGGRQVLGDADSTEVEKGNAANHAEDGDDDDVIVCKLGHSAAKARAAGGIVGEGEGASISCASSRLYARFAYLDQRVVKVLKFPARSRAGDKPEHHAQGAHDAHAENACVGQWGGSATASRPQAPCADGCATGQAGP